MLLLGIDLGTTGTKAVLVDDRGAAIASATREHPLSTPRPGWSEQDRESWWRSACEAVRAVTEHAHRDLGILRVFAKVYEGNVQSERVLEKAGFRREARLQAAIMKDGRILDAHLFAHVAIPGG